MALSPISRAARYREIAYRLWRMSTDRSLDIGFETRSRLATIADDLATRFAGQGPRATGKTPTAP